jgi:hypothetical protein
MAEPQKPRLVDRRTKIRAWLACALVRVLYSTLHIRVVNENEVNEIMRQGGAILATWHGRTLIPMARVRGRGYRMLVSLSRDGDFLSQYLCYCGLKVTRGSTGKRGAAATREVINALKNGEVLCFTPDGPRGPSQVAQPGAAYFAQRSGKPIFAGGIAAQRCTFAGSWDNYMIPHPFSRAVWVYSEPIFVGPDEDLEKATQRIQNAINRVQAEAEAAVGRLTKLAPPQSGQAGDERARHESA